MRPSLYGRRHTLPSALTQTSLRSVTSLKSRSGEGVAAFAGRRVLSVKAGFAPASGGGGDGAALATSSAELAAGALAETGDRFASVAVSSFWNGRGGACTRRALPPHWAGTGSQRVPPSWLKNTDPAESTATRRLSRAAE